MYDQSAAPAAAAAAPAAAAPAASADAGAAPAAPAANTRVYCGNLPWSCDWRRLKDHFRTAGNVEFADVFSDPTGRSKGCGIVQFTTAEDAKNAIATLNDSDLDGRKIFVREDQDQSQRKPRAAPAGGAAAGGYAPAAPYRQYRAPGGAAPYGGAVLPAPMGAAAGVPMNRVPGANAGRQVYVGNIPNTATWQELKDHFKAVGEVQRADVVRMRNSPKCHGIVIYTTPEAANAAIDAFNNTDFGGRTIFVKHDAYA